jgi:hypothetical protein
MPNEIHTTNTRPNVTASMWSSPGRLHQHQDVSIAALFFKLIIIIKTAPILSSARDRVSASTTYAGFDVDPVVGFAVPFCNCAGNVSRQ